MTDFSRQFSQLIVTQTKRLQVTLTEARSRSFRRLKNALAQILQAHEEGKAIVTPSSKTD